jgi:hypothetical protein
LPPKKARKRTMPNAIPIPATEEWRDIAGYDGKYQVSDAGRVRSFAYGYWKLLKVNRVTRSQVVHAHLCRGGIVYTRSVHRLVLEAFVGSCPEGMECCHQNGIPFDNRLVNLRWDTKSHNQLDKRRHGTAGYLSPDDVREIRRAVKDGATQREVAERFGVNPSHVNKIVTGKKWRGLE